MPKKATQVKTLAPKIKIPGPAKPNKQWLSEYGK